MYKVIKRNDTVVEFNLEKISTAIKKAFDACKINYTDDVIQLLSLRVTGDYVSKIKDDKVTVEDIQDSVEKVLSECGYQDVAKAYILYRKQREKVRNIAATSLDYKKVVDSYLKVDDWRVKENSTVTYSVGGLILSNSGAVTANYWLNEIYDDEIANAHKSCEMHIHDLSMLTGYCAGWSLKQLIQEGIAGVNGKVSSKPASHLSTLCNQMVNFLGIMQNEWAGAQAFSSFDTYLAPFVKVDNLDYKEIKQCIQSFIFGVNTPSRWGCVDADTELLTVNGFKKYSEIKKGDEIYTWKDGNLEINKINEIVIKEHHGKMHQYISRGYIQEVTPDHRVLCKKHNLNEYTIKHSDEIFDVKTPYYLPTAFKTSSLSNKGKVLTKAEIMFAAILYTDGYVDIRNGNVHKVSIYKSPNRYGNELICDLSNELGLKYSFTQTTGGFNTPVNKYSYYGDSAKKIINLIGNTKKKIDVKFISMGSYESELFLKTWCQFDGNADKLMLQVDNDEIASSIQHIALRAGYTSYPINTKKAHYIKIRQTENIQPGKRKAIDYNGIVWCPNVDNGTAVFRKDGCVFISGQCQAPFTNITLDWTVPEDLAEQNCIVGGKELDFKYKDCKTEMDMINKAFIETMIEGDANGRGFQYPIPTYSITKEFDWSETENNKLLFDMTAKYGTPYFSNYVNSDMKPSDVRSMCCRLRLELKELRRKNGGFFGSGESTGSVGVVTLNMPRIAYLATDENDFYKRLDNLMDIAARSLDIKRKTITELMENGLYPYTKRYLGTFNNHFSTIGLVGMNEVCLNAKWLRKDLTDKDAQKFTKEVLVHMRDRLVVYQEKYQALYNLEATPAESTSFRLAKHDKQDYPDIITAGKENETPYYTNSSHLPVGYTDDMFSALDIQDELQTLYTSGTVFHAFLGEKMPDWKSAMNLVRKIASNYKLPYYTMSPTYSICPDHGYIAGEAYTCPKCGKKTEVWSRITGYYRPVQNWNDGKIQEFKHRKEYKPNYDGINENECEECKVSSKPKIEETSVEISITFEKEITLLATKTCPKCKQVAMMLEQKGTDFAKIYAEDNPELMEKLNATQAPTLVVAKEGGTLLYSGIADVTNFLREKGLI